MLNVLGGDIILRCILTQYLLDWTQSDLTDTRFENTKDRTYLGFRSGAH